MSNSNKFYPDSHLDRKVFCDNLALFRKELALSQSQFADKINALKGTNYTLKNISSWESGTALPPLTLLPVIAFTLNVPVMAFFAQEDFAAKDDSGNLGTYHQGLQEIEQLFKSDPEKALVQLKNQLDHTLSQLKQSESIRKSLEADYKDIQNIFKKR